MPSTVIRDIDYDPGTCQLTVIFVSGKEYVYDGVPEDLFNLFRNARAKGEFFNAAVRDRYSFREVTPARPKLARAG